MAIQDPFSSPKLDHFWGGFKPTPPSPRDYRLPHLGRRGAAVLSAGSGSADLRNWQGQSQMIPIRDQGQVGSCTGFAWSRMRAAAAARYHIENQAHPDLGDDISPRFIYDLERQAAGTYPQDSGANMRDGGDVLAQYGVAPERYCPYTGNANNGAIAKEITAEAYQAALDYGVSTYYKLSGSGQALVNAIVGCIDEGWACIIAILVPQSFEQVGPDGRVPMPSKGEQVLGGHAITVCGYYIDQSYAGGVALVVANSWSEGYGDRGYCYLPGAWATTSAPQYGPWLAESWTLR